MKSADSFYHSDIAAVIEPTIIGRQLNVLHSYSCMLLEYRLNY